MATKLANFFKKNNSPKTSGYGLIGEFKENKGFLTITEHLTYTFLKEFPKESDEHLFDHIYHYKLGSFFDLFDFYIKLCTFLDITPNCIDHLTNFFHLLFNSPLNKDIKKFKEHLQLAINEIHLTDIEISNKLSLLSKKECLRLYEAIKCLNNDCNYAAVVMAVSAVESRLHKLLKDTNTKLYKKQFERTTLGGIIELFRRDTRYKDKKFDKLKKILPDKHKPLMETLNVYRIFSAHPKEEIISCQTAKTIVAFSFLLLIDERLKTKN